MKLFHKDRNNFAFLTTAPVPKVVSSLAVPTIISMLVTSFYQIADTYFVGRINTQSTAAVGIVSSVMFIIHAVGFFFGHGSGNYISRKLGSKDKTAASKMVATGFIYSISLGLLITVSGLIFLRPISIALGSTSTILPYTESYLSLILIGAPLMTGSLTLNNQMRLQGNAAYSMVGIVSGAVLNLLLDPIFIFVFDMGIYGTALATVVSQGFSFSLLLLMTYRGENLKIDFRNFTPNFSMISEIVSGGAPSLTRQALGAISAIFLNYAAGQYGGDECIAAMSIITRLSFFINSVLIGFGQGFQPLCGFSYGAKLFSRVKEGYWFCVKVGTAFLLIVGVVGFIFSEEIIQLFRDDPTVVSIGQFAFRCQLITYPLGAVVMYSNMMMQTIRKPWRASILSAARQGIFFIPCILILPNYLGLFGVEISQAVADFFSFLLALPLTGSVLYEINQEEIQNKGKE